MEDAIVGIFEGGRGSTNDNKSPEDLIIRSVARAVGNLTYANYMINNIKNETDV